MGSRMMSFFVVFVVLLILASLFSVAAPTSEKDFSEKYFLLRDTGEEISDRLDSSDMDLIERYDNFVLIRGTENELETIDKDGLDIDTLHNHTKVYVKGKTLDISSKRSVSRSENTQFLIRMVGPVRSEWRNGLESKGVDILNYVPNYAYHVRMDPALLRELNELEFVEWIGEYRSDYKIQSDIETGTVSIDIIRDENTISKLNSLININASKDRGSRSEILTEIRDPDIFERLVEMDDVIYIQNIKEPSLTSEMGSQLLGGFWDPDDPSSVYRETGDFGAYVNHLGYTGEGLNITIADTGIGDGTQGDAGHDDFTGRVIGGTDFGVEDDWSDGYGHGTHTAGLAAGDTHSGTGLQYQGHAPYYLSQGLAYDSGLYAQKLFDDKGDWSVPITVSYYDIIEDAKQNGDVYIHSNSWGEEEGDGAYSDSDSDYDRAVRDADPEITDNQPMVIVASAGNDGEKGYSTIGSPGNAKNVITVGATESYMPDAHLYGSSGSSDDPYSIPSFSSQGWTEDNRVKPTVVAPGRVSLSTSTPMLGESNLWGLYSEDQRYEWGSGTSQSNPNVAGAAAVVSQYYENTYGHLPSPAMVKAILINSARDLETDHSGDGKIDHIPNRYEGWGLVDLTNVLGSDVQYVSNDQTSLLETGDADGYYLYPDRNDEPMKITLTWTDKHAEAEDSPTLKNDLNLEVISPSGERYKGNAFDEGWTRADTDTSTEFDDNGDGFDNRNVVENVYIHPDEVERGFYEVRVEGYNIPEDTNGDGTSNQDYALMAHNALNVTSNGSVNLDQDKYALEDTVNITLMDSDLIGEGSTEIEMVSDTDPEGKFVELFEGDIDGVFTGSIQTSGEQNDEILHVSHDDLIEAVYHDENPSEEKTASAYIDGLPAEIRDVEVKEKLAAELSLKTDEPAVISVNYGIDEEMDMNSETETLTEDHSMILDNLTPNRSYSFKINVTDEVGNWRIYDNEGEYYHFRSSNIDEVEEGNIGWSPDDGWKVVDSDSYSGDLSWNFGQGDYGRELNESLISPHIDTSRWQNVSLSWYHRYDLEQGYDGGIVEVNDGSGWEKITPEDGYDEELDTGYNNPLEGEQAFTGNQDEWVEEVVNISNQEDPILFRFRVGTDTHDTDHEGWWIDDVRIEGVVTPTANFTYVPERPTCTDDIQFYDTSYDLDGDVNYSWDFDDGNRSYEKEPVKRYDRLGSYDVTLTVRDDSGMESSVTKTIEVVNIPPRPDFTYEPADPTAKDDVEFISDSYDPDGDIVEYHWDFDDGNVSDGEVVNHSYSFSGSYLVSLVVWDDNGEENQTTKEVEIENLPPEPSFDYSPAKIYTGHEVQFEEDSFDYDGWISEWSWDFGDGESSDILEPTHTYEEAGEYEIALTIEDNKGTRNSTQSIIKVESSDPIADFSFDPEKPLEGGEVRFSDNSTERPDEIVSWSWEFDDGAVSEEQDPTHVFQEPGEYIVELTVTDENGDSNTTTKTVVVEKKPFLQWWGWVLLAGAISSGIIIGWLYIKYWHIDKGDNS
ncbi:MAG: PKD domain-containing protein [Candidatus Saliniplasma sp.]